MIVIGKKTVILSGLVLVIAVLGTVGFFSASKNNLIVIYITTFYIYYTIIKKSYQTIRPIKHY